MIRFVSYDGKYPCLCNGNLVLEIDGEIVDFPNCLMSGGSVWFDENWMEHVEVGRWGIDRVSVSQKFGSKYDDRIAEILEVVNENIPWGCCGGCV